VIVISRKYYLLAAASLLYLTAYCIVSVIAVQFTEIDSVAFSTVSSVTGFMFVSVCVSLLLASFVQLLFSRIKLFNILAISSIYPLVILFVVLIQEINGRDWFKSYGDSGSLGLFIERGTPFSRWLVGTTALIDMFTLFNNFVFSISAQQFVVVASAVSMCCSTIALIRVFGTKSIVVLPITTPIWIAFSFGYDEYYPFIVGVFLLVALWIIVKPDDQFSYLQLGLTGVLPALYVGFAPLAVFAMIKVLRKAKTMKRFATGFCLVALTYLMAIEISWPAGHSNYLLMLPVDMHLGDTRDYMDYEGSPLSTNSPFFSFGSAFSLFRLRDVLFNAFFAGGTSGFIFLFAKFVRSIKQQRVSDQGTSQRTGQTKLGHIFVLWYVFYFVFMTPKLGPLIDIDLYFASNLVFAIWSGVLLDKLFDFRQLSTRARANALSAVVALNGPIVGTLVIFGLRR
jgi:hypothetical protein